MGKWRRERQRSNRPSRTTSARQNSQANQASQPQDLRLAASVLVRVSGRIPIKKTCNCAFESQSPEDSGPLGRFLAGEDIVLQRLNFTLLRFALSDSRESVPTLLRKKKFYKGLRSSSLKLKFQRGIPHDSETPTPRGVFAPQYFVLFKFLQKRCHTLIALRSSISAKDAYDPEGAKNQQSFHTWCSLTEHLSYLLVKSE